MLTRLVFFISLVAFGTANPYLTSPTASSVCSGGSTCSIKWQDDGKTPALGDFGDARVGLYVGNTNQQTLLQLITDSVNVATTASIDFPVDPNAGQDDDIYFIRFDSLKGMNGSAPYQAFSSKFTLNNMSGTFNSTVQAQINGASGSGSSASSSGGAASGNTTPTSSTASASKSASATANRAAASASASASASSSVGRVSVANGLLGVAGAVAAFFAVAF